MTKPKDPRSLAYAMQLKSTTHALEALLDAQTRKRLVAESSSPTVPTTAASDPRLDINTYESLPS